MTIYILTRGEYSDYGIIAVFTDKALAERVRDKLNETHEATYSDECSIEEWEADKGYEEIASGQSGYEVTLHRETRNLLSIKRDNNLIFRHGIVTDHPSDAGFTVYLFAESDVAAIKAANERVTRWIAEGKPTIVAQGQEPE